MNLKKTNHRLLKLCIMLCMILMFLSGCKDKSKTSIEKVSFAKCIDGDTAKFSINDKITTVRFLAIDSPETVKPNTPVQPYGKKASDYTCNVITNAREIRLEYESSNKLDKYGRTLAWVFADDKLIQKNLVEQGYAKVAYIYGNYKYTNIIKQAELQAKKEHKGIWNLWKKK